MAPRKHIGKQLWLNFGKKLLTRLELGAFVIPCLGIYALSKLVLPENLANLVFWILIVQGFSLGRSMEWAAALTRGILQTILDLLPK
jgi:hypothetical protein